MEDVCQQNSRQTVAGSSLDWIAEFAFQVDAMHLIHTLQLHGFMDDGDDGGAHKTVMITYCGEIVHTLPLSSISSIINTDFVGSLD